MSIRPIMPALIPMALIMLLGACTRPDLGSPQDYRILGGGMADLVKPSVDPFGIEVPPYRFWILPQLGLIFAHDDVVPGYGWSFSGTSDDDTYDTTIDLSATGLGCQLDRMTWDAQLAADDGVVWTLADAPAMGNTIGIHRYHGASLVFETRGPLTLTDLRRICQGAVRTWERNLGCRFDPLYAIEDDDLGDEQRALRFAYLLATEDQTLADRAAENLVDLGPVRMGTTAETIAVMVAHQVLAGDSLVLRWHLPRLLTNLGPAAAPAVPILAEAVSDGNCRRRENALIALEAIGPLATPLVDDLLPLVMDPDKDVRWYAVRAIAATRVETPAVVTMLAQALADPGPSRKIRAAAAVALAQMTRPPIEALDALLGCIATYDACEQDGRYSSQIEARRWAAEALGTLGPGAEAAIPQLLVLLDDGSHLVQTAAARALGRMGAAAKEALPRLRMTAGKPDWLRAVWLEAETSIRTAQPQVKPESP